MNIAVEINALPREALPALSEAGPASKRIVVAYGFWIFILSDIVMFAALFAAYAVLVRATAGGATESSSSIKSAWRSKPPVFSPRAIRAE